MKNTWRNLFRRLAAGCAVTGSLAWSSAMCYAVQVAFDSGSDPVYATSWLAGQDGGFGFGPWNFDGTYNTLPPGQQAMDDGLGTGVQTSSPHNDVGRAWTMYNPEGRPRGVGNGTTGTDIARAGRALDSPLQVGQTVSVVFDNPEERAFFRGYAIKFNTTAANGCYAGDNCTTPVYDPGSVGTAWQLQMFDYNSYGNWQWFTYVDPNPDNNYPLFDYHTAEAGGRLDFTLTSASTFDWTLTPLAHPELAVTQSGTFEDPGQIVWIELQQWNSDSDFYPGMIPNPAATDFYIRSLEITSPAPPGLPGDFNGDNKVDAADYVVFRKNNGTNNALPNDGGLGTPIGSAHYDLWKANFGDTAGSGGGAAVPEPSTLVYVVFVVAGLLLWGVRRPSLICQPCVVKKTGKRE
jgi:hypothetical protein